MFEALTSLNFGTDNQLSALFLSSVLFYIVISECIVLFTQCVGLSFMIDQYTPLVLLCNKMTAMAVILEAVCVKKLATGHKSLSFQIYN